MFKSLCLTLLLSLCLCSGALAAVPAPAQAPDASNKGSILTRFLPGMQRDAVQKLATFTKGPEDSLVGNVQWDNAPWTVVLQFTQNTVDSVYLQTPLENSALREALSAIDENKLLPLTVTREGKETMLFNMVSKEGKEPADCTAAMHDELTAYASQDTGKILVTLTTPKAYSTFVDVDKGVQGADLAKVNEERLLVLQMDKADDTLALVISTIEKFNQ